MSAARIRYRGYLTSNRIPAARDILVLPGNRAILRIFGLADPAGAGAIGVAFVYGASILRGRTRDGRSGCCAGS